MNEIHLRLLEQMQLTEENLKQNGRYATESLEVNPKAFRNLTIDKLIEKQNSIQTHQREKLFDYTFLVNFSICSKHPELIHFKYDGTIIWEKTTNNKGYKIVHNIEDGNTTINIEENEKSIQISVIDNLIEFTRKNKRRKQRLSYFNWISQNDIENENSWFITSAVIKLNPDKTVQKSHIIISGKNYGLFHIDFKDGIYSVYHSSKKGNITRLGDFIIGNNPITINEYIEALKALLNNLNISLDSQDINSIKDIVGCIPVPALEEALRTITNTPSKSRTRKRN